VACGPSYAHHRRARSSTSSYSLPSGCSEVHVPLAVVLGRFVYFDPSTSAFRNRVIEGLIGIRSTNPYRTSRGDQRRQSEIRLAARTYLLQRRRSGHAKDRARLPRSEPSAPARQWPSQQKPSQGSAPEHPTPSSNPSVRRVRDCARVAAHQRKHIARQLLVPQLRRARKNATHRGAAGDEHAPYAGDREPAEQRHTV
jgi:hypothetical protein